MQCKNLADINFSSIRSIAFDLFNTLVYIDKPLKPYKELFAALSLTEEQQKASRTILLTQDTSTIYSAFPVQHHKKLDLLIENFNQEVQAEVKSTALYSDSKEVLKKLSQKYSIHLVSNLATPYKDVVKQLEIEHYFRSILFSCDLGVSKPDKEIFQLLGNSSKEILMVGDSYHSDFLGGQNAGLQSILIRRNKNSPTRPIPTIDSLLQLIDLL